MQEKSTVTWVRGGRVIMGCERGQSPPCVACPCGTPAGEVPRGTTVALLPHGITLSPSPSSQFFHLSALLPQATAQVTWLLNGIERTNKLIQSSTWDQPPGLEVAAPGRGLAGWWQLPAPGAPSGLVSQQYPLRMRLRPGEANLTLAVIPPSPQTPYTT